MYSEIEAKKQEAELWFKELRDIICKEFEAIEQEYGSDAKFERKVWDREGGGQGVMSIIRGKVLEKAGVNVSTVFGSFPQVLRDQFPGGAQEENFWASGISLVSHGLSPHVPIAHMNTRMIVTSKATLAGVADLTPTFKDDEDTEFFHKLMKEACDSVDKSYYPKFKKGCDEYFWIKHRKEMRGVGGVFFEHLNTGDWDKDFALIKAVGLAFAKAYPAIIRKSMFKPWTKEEKDALLVKRGRYVEYNLLYDRGTKFGILTNANPEAYLMPLPPEAKWI